MKEFWLKLDPSASSESKMELLKTAQGRCDAVMLAPDDIPLVSNLKLRTVSQDDRAEIKLVSGTRIVEQVISGDSAAEIVVKDASDEQRALQLAEMGIRYIIVRCPNWKIIPLENLIARARDKAELLAEVSDLSEAKTALQALELGVDGVVFSPKVPGEIDEMERFLKESGGAVSLVKARVISAKTIGSGARVCVDTCELMQPGEGMLVGSQSSGLFLVEAEVHRNPHVEPRPFRVNAGPVSSYVLTPGFKTRYLAELKAGDEILIINRSGATRPGHVGRVKIERRPMTLIESESNGHSFSLIVQNAETVRLISNDASKSVSDLRPGDEILVRIEEGGRHFGTLVADEMVIER
jgi:3-dehydroquinate synthase II